MYDRTHLDVLTEMPEYLFRRIAANENIRELLTDIPGASRDALENVKGNWRHFFDYDFIPGTQQESLVSLCVDIDIINIKGATMTVDVYVYVLIPKSLMEIAARTLPGYTGSRMSNLVRMIDVSVRGMRDAGIGTLNLEHIRTVSSGNPQFCKKEMRYSISDFKVDRSLLP